MTHVSIPDSELIHVRIVSLNSESNDLKYAVPGGLIGVGTLIDPTLCRADRLVGHVLGLKGRLPDIYSEIEVNFQLLKRLIGVKAADGKQVKVSKLMKNEVIMVNIGSTAIGAKVAALRQDAAKVRTILPTCPSFFTSRDMLTYVSQLVLISPACTTIGAKAALSRRIEKHWRLIGVATVES